MFDNKLRKIQRETNPSITHLTFCFVDCSITLKEGNDFGKNTFDLCVLLLINRILDVVVDGNSNA